MRVKIKYASIGAVTVTVVASIILLVSFIKLERFRVERRINEHRIVKRSMETQKLNCETIHIGIVSFTQDSTNDFYIMLKSLFFYRNNPLHFHIIVNNMSKKIITRLITTWGLTQVTMSYYNINVIDKKKQFQDNFHVTRLLFPKLIILNEIEKIIILNTNFAFNGDIYELWEEFNNFGDDQVLGMAMNYQKQRNDNERIDERPNSDILLYNLNNLNKYGMDNLWKEIKSKQMFEYNEYAQRNIILSVLQTAKLIYTLPCIWNTKQRGTGCISQAKVVNKKSLDLYSNEVYRMFLNLNGNLIRKDSCLCGRFDTRAEIYKKSINDSCYDFPETESRKRRTFLYFANYNYVDTDYDVTLVSQLSLQKMKRLEEMARRWYGPMSLALYVTDAELQSCIEFINNSPILQNRDNIGYHAVFKDGNYHLTNVLRNIALNEVHSPYVFLNDIDLMPVGNLHLTLKMYLSHVKNMTKQALVVPAFETRKDETVLPSDTETLLDMLAKKEVFIFQEDTRKEGHHQTNYEKWKTAKKPYKVTWKDKYEPYIVVEKGVAKYDERFFAYGWNKISQIMELEAQGYEFTVLPNTFVVHKYHPNSLDKKKFLKQTNYKSCLKSLKEKSVKELYAKYGRRFEID